MMLNLDSWKSMIEVYAAGVIEKSIISPSFCLCNCCGCKTAYRAVTDLENLINKKVLNDTVINIFYSLALCVSWEAF